MEGYLFGIPAIAFSQVEKGWAHIDAAAATARDIVQRVIAQQLVGAAPWLLNINIPNRPLADLKPLKVCRLGRRHAAERVITQTNPRGDTMYWIGGAGPAKDDADGTDFHAALQGHVCLTPLKVDLTDHDLLGYWAQTASRLARQLPSRRWPKAPDDAPARLSGPPGAVGGAGAQPAVTRHPVAINTVAKEQYPTGLRPSLA